MLTKKHRSDNFLQILRNTMNNLLLFCVISTQLSFCLCMEELPSPQMATFIGNNQILIVNSDSFAIYDPHTKTPFFEKKYNNNDPIYDIAVNRAIDCIAVSRHKGIDIVDVKQYQIVKNRGLKSPRFALLF